jgi:YjbE family integral membrane protein
MTPDYLLRIFKITLIDLALAGDNALVIALAVRTLPARQQLLGRMYGMLGAIALRLVFIAVVSYLLDIPLLEAVGGVMLVWIAFKLVRQSSDGDGEGHVRHGTTLLEAVWVIIVADAVMSLDNVIGVAGAAEGHLGLVAFGIALSIPIVVWGSGVLARLMNRFPWIILLAGGILGDVSGKMIAHDHFITEHFGHAPSMAEGSLRALLAVGIVVVGWLTARARAHTPSGPMTSDA